MADNIYKLTFTMSDGSTKEVEFTAPQGETGPQGPAGQNGVSVTHSWNGTTLTVTSASGTSSADLKGAKGDTGATGATGPAGKDGSAGKDGTSVTVKSVSESTADGGSNVITFSDGKTVTIKNGSKGSDGAKGDKGDTGPMGPAGSDASVTATSIKTALGYTPANEQTVSQLSELKANKNGLTLGIHTDGLVYLFADGQPVGAGIELTTADVYGYVDENNNIIVSGNLADGTYSVKYEMENGNTVNIGNLVLDTNVYYTVTNNLTQCTNSNSATQAIGGQSYSATIAAKSGYELKSVSVTMGGTAVSVSNGKINIANVTGNIVITAVATEVSMEPTYTNLLPTAIDTDGSAYGNGKGYISGYKLSCSSAGGTPSAASDAYVSGFMPINDNHDVVRIKNVTLNASASINNIIFYNKDKTKLHAVSGIAGGFANPVKVDAGNVYRCTPASWSSNEQAVNIGFFRFSCGGITDETIVTVNEEIV